jgi:hypothetical protein
MKSMAFLNLGRGTQRWRLCWLAGFAGPWLAAGASAQTLQVLPQNAIAGEWVVLEIAFQPAAGPALTAVQWELEIPVSALDLDGAPLTRAPLAVKDAGKSVNCAVSERSAERLLLPCILAGGQKTIPAGTMVLLSVKIGPGARPGAARIRLRKAIGVTSDLKQVSIEAAEGELIIRAR